MRGFGVTAVSVTQKPSQSVGYVSTFIKARENPPLNLCFDPNTQLCTAAVWTRCYGLTGHRAICVLQTACARQKRDRGSLELKLFDCIPAAGAPLPERVVYFECGFKLLS